MGSNTDTAAGEADFRALLEIAIRADIFSSNWEHCDRIASYVARMVSHNRTDSLLYLNLFSSALNELLETAFRSHKGDGEIACKVLRAGPIDRVELTIPCDAETKTFYRDAVAVAQRPDAAESYMAALFAEGPVDGRIGLLELAVDYRAKFSLGESEPSSVRLVADLALDEA
jgi:hypothetical protein